MTELYPVLDVSSWSVEEGEASGGEEKQWLCDPDGTLWLFKPRTEHETWRQGEDWAEKISAEVAQALGVPAAQVELAQRRSQRGSISRSLRSPGWELQHGSLLLTELVPEHQPMAKDRQGHTVANIKTVLDVVDPPDDAVVPVGMTGFDVFAGYLLLDALVANQDRHEENWAVLRPLPGGGPMRLSGSYDHGSSLGFNLQDERRLLIMKQGVRTWANKGRAQRFERVSDGRLSLVQLAGKALSLTAVTTRQHWIGRLDSVPPASWSEILDRV